MAINAKSSGAPRELVKPGLHAARCYKMIEIGTCTETIKGDTKQLQKVNITWELPLLTKVFDEAKGPQPLVISAEYTISMGDKSNLRKMLTSWRGKPFSEDQAKNFDITKLLGIPCMINITHKPSKSDATRIYEEVSAVTPVPEGMTVPPQVNPSVELSYDKWDDKLFDALPDFIKNKMKATPEYQNMKNPQNNTFIDEQGQPLSDLPFDQIIDDKEPPF